MTAQPSARASPSAGAGAGGARFCPQGDAGKCHIYVTGSERQAVAEAGPYLHNYWTVADAQHPGCTAARRRQVAEQIARGNVIAGELQRCIDLIRR